ncbi:hypothetical protein EGN73_01125 [Arthrospiribacter ruber]|uniref:Capsule assembly protein Wzi n=1 Tax=Arthrospiribacter ruber TaxID=2487934 RepID=A0A951IQ89_9BACT|nr:capsule assembly Wzi family protein [Arthrospiribacter ruber]MBW3466415.1 hypothetical protein [Arthrospiribacter ruber]
MIEWCKLLNWKWISLVLIFFVFQAQAQFLPVGYPILEENARRSQLLFGLDSVPQSFANRTLTFGDDLLWKLDVGDSFLNKLGFEFAALPVLAMTRFNGARPYGWGAYGLPTNRGFQQYASAGVFVKLGFLRFQIQPEFRASQFRPYSGFPSDFPDPVNRAKFFFWNNGDYPEDLSALGRAGFSWGQSSLTAVFGAFEIGVSTRNLWWGPGQWNALIFTNNAQGFPHLTLNTHKPAKTFLGNFEGQLIMGRVEDSGILPSMNGELNDRFARPFSGDWRYLNAINLIYSPKWIPGLTIGVTRTAQVYRENMGNEFIDYFRVFEGLQKEQFFDETGSTVDFDQEGVDQQATAYVRLVFPKANFELYTEYGRRDHPFNWRDLTISPEHARAYLMGFKKLFPLDQGGKYIQVRGEMVQQTESVNTYVRNTNNRGLTWHTHTRARGFGNYGMPMGVGLGLSSNVQTLELAMVENYNKIGLLFERLENQQDFFYRAFLDDPEHRPWVDLSLGLLFDHQWDRLLFSSKLQFIYGRNYQWQLDPASTPEFPRGQNLNSLHGQVSLVYLWN